MIKEVLNTDEKKLIAKVVLDDLPEWFGIPEYTENFIVKSSEMPFFAVYVDNVPVGFVSLKETSKYTAEIFCMGILKKYQRNSLGQKLFSYFENYAKQKGYKYLQVKTVETGKYEEYDKTNLFYKSVGFCELEMFPNLWDEWNPCQIYIKAI